MPCRDIPLRDGKQAGQPRLRSEQIVAAGIEAIVGEANSRSTTVSARDREETRNPSPAPSRAPCRRAPSIGSSGCPAHRRSAAGHGYVRPPIFLNASIQNTRSGGAVVSDGGQHVVGGLGGLVRQPLQRRRAASRSFAPRSSGFRSPQERRRVARRARLLQPAGHRGLHAPAEDCPPSRRGRPTRAGRPSTRRRRWRAAIRWPARFPLSTDET